MPPNNIENAFAELMKDGQVNISVAPARARGPGVRGGMVAPMAPVRETSFQKVNRAIERMRGKQVKNAQNMDPTGEKLAEVLAETLPVNVTYMGRKASKYAKYNPASTAKQIEENILSNTPGIMTSPEVNAAYNDFIAEKKAMAPITNQSAAFMSRKELDKMFYLFFKTNTPYSSIGRKIFNAYDKQKKTGDKSDIIMIMQELISGGYPNAYVSNLLSYVGHNYNELKDHYAYYNAKASSGGKRKHSRRRISRRRKTRRR